MSKGDITNFKEYIDYVSSAHADRIAFQMRRRIINEKVYYQDIPSLVAKFDRLLTKSGINPGDRVLLWGLNSTEYSLTLLTLFSTGRTSVPIDYRTSDETVEKIIQQTTPKIAIISKFLTSQIIPKYIKQIIYFEDIMELIAGEDISEGETTKYQLDTENTAQIVYTSGTTGVPKGVVLKQKSIITNVLSLHGRIPKLKDYRTVSVLPLSHAYEQVAGLLLGLLCGTEITYLSRVNSLQLRKGMLEVKPTYLILVPQLLNVLHTRIESRIRDQGKEESVAKILKVADKLPKAIRKLLFKKVHQSFGGKLEFIGMGGAPLNINTAVKFHKMGFSLLQGYGATELTAVATFNDNPDDLYTVGEPLPGVEIKLTDDNEILVKSESLAGGYYQNPEKSAEAFKDGWYYTGDIGKVNENGTVEILGRDVFKLVLKNGEKVYAEDLENKINAHKEVKESCILSIDDDGADKIHLCLILKDPANTSELERIISEINSTLESKQQILSYSLWPEDDFPRTHTLKINRKLLKERVFADLAAQNDTSEVDDSSQDNDLLLKVLSTASQTDYSSINEESKLQDDLKLDSLSRAELMATIEEELAVSIEGVEVKGETTVAELREIVKNAETSSQNDYLPTWQYKAIPQYLRNFFLNLFIFPLHSLSTQIKIDEESRERIKNLKEPAIIIMNHTGLYDSLITMRILGWRANKIVLMAFKGYWDVGRFAKIIEFGGAFPLDQSGTNLIHTFKKLADLSRDGRFIQVAPQGEFERGEKKPMKSGFIFMAKELKLPVIAVNTQGYEKIFPAPKDTKKMSVKEYLPKSRGVVKVKVSRVWDYETISLDEVNRFYEPS